MHIKQVLIDRGIPFSQENGMVICDHNRLDLHNNQITSLDGFTFNGRWLFLSNNQITSLEGFIFNGNILDLRDNQITALDGYTFNGNNLYLHNNQITSLNGFTFNGNLLYLNNNPINIERTITRETWEREYSDPYVNLFLNCASRPSGAGN